MDVFDSKETGVLDALLFYAQQEAAYRVQNPMSRGNDPAALELKHSFYANLSQAYRKHPERRKNGNKAALRYVRYQRRKTNAQLHPTLLNMVWYSPLVQGVLQLVAGRFKQYRALDKQIRQAEKQQVQEYNLQHLQTAMNKAGFKLNMEGPLRKMLSHNLPEFHLRYSDPNYPQTDFVCHFKKVPGTESYYFEKFDVTARPTLADVINDNPRNPRKTFSMQHAITFTAEEATQIIHRRPIAKKINGKEQWLSQDLSGRIVQTSFNIEDALKKLPIKERVNSAEWNTLVSSLKAGHSREITVTVNNTDEKMQISVSPRPHRLNIKDKNDRPVDIDRLTSGKLNPNTKKIMEQAMNGKLKETIDLDAPTVKYGRRH